MIIYLCIKFQSNTPILSKDIAWKPFVLRTDGRTYVRTAEILYAPPTPNENGGGIKTHWLSLHFPAWNRHCLEMFSFSMIEEGNAHHCRCLHKISFNNVDRWLFIHLYS